MSFSTQLYIKDLVTEIFRGNIMKKENSKRESVFKLSIKDLLIQIYKTGKENSSEKGAISSLETVRSNIRALANSTKDRTLTLMYIDLGVIIAHLSGSRDIFIKKSLKDELQKLGRSEETVEVISNAFDSVGDFDDFIEMDVVQDQELSEKINPTVEILPTTEREGMVFDIHRSLQKGFNKAVHEEMPKLMEDFYDNLLEALEKESCEDIKEIFEAEKLKWHRLTVGFP